MNPEKDTRSTNVAALLKRLNNWIDTERSACTHEELCITLLGAAVGEIARGTKWKRELVLQATGTAFDAAVNCVAAIFGSKG